MWTRESWERECCLYTDERYLVDAIKKHLCSQTDKAVMFKYGFSIEDMLNGRIEGDENGLTVQCIFTCWNAILGWKEFG